MQELSKEQQMTHDNAPYCHICKNVFGNKKNHVKVRDHDHYTGEYRGAAHLLCNLRYSMQIYIPVYFHNGTNYDFNLIIAELAKEFRSEMKCIPSNTNKYMSFSIPIKKEVKESNKQKKKVITYYLKFMDTARHNNRALSTFVHNLSEIYSCKWEENSDKDIKIHVKKERGGKLLLTRCKTVNTRKSQYLYELAKRLPSTFKLCNKNADQFVSLLKKGIYPYKYMDSMDKFDEIALPCIEEFYINLQLKNISKDEYNHAKKVWEHFEIKNLGEWHDLYVQADTAQLSHVFENFRSLCLKEYQLDPTYFVSKPSLAFEAMLKITKAKIELFTDTDMVLMTEKGIRGRLTQVIRKYAVANNKYLRSYDKTKDTTYLKYLDANNLYGYAMDKKLPLYGYEWDDKSIFTEDFIKIMMMKGYLLEVDVGYPKELHIAHQDLPFLPEKGIKSDKEFKHKVTKEINQAHKKVYKTFNITHEPGNK